MRVETEAATNNSNDQTERISVLQGVGLTEDEDTAWRFFDASTRSTFTTGLRQKIIERLGSILQALFLGSDIDVDGFERYTAATLSLFETSYYSRVPHCTEHLVNGPQIIS